MIVGESGLGYMEFIHSCVTEKIHEIFPSSLEVEIISKLSLKILLFRKSTIKKSRKATSKWGKNLTPITSRK